MDAMSKMGIFFLRSPLKRTVIQVDASGGGFHYLYTDSFLGDSIAFDGK